MNRAGEILTHAASLVAGDRAKDHGDMFDTHDRIGALWSAYTGVQLTALDVAQMMVLVKMARASGNPRHADNYVDMAGYSGCAGQIAEQMFPAVTEEINRNTAEG